MNPEELYERTSPLAHKRPEELSEAEMVAALNAHPRIGAPVAELSAHSRREQGREANAVVERELARLNDEYERKFGFRFVVFVNGRPRSEILEVLRQRLRRSREEEMREGLAAIIAIAKDRAQK